MKTYFRKMQWNKLLPVIFIVIFFYIAGAGVLIAAPRPDVETVKFCYTPNAAAKSVCVAGSFNGWSAFAAPMKETSGGAWEAHIDLPAGSHQYKFVINGNVWVCDPANPEVIDDGQGGKNSVIHAGRMIFKRLSGISGKDDSIEADGLIHKQNAAGYLDFTADDRVRLVLRSFKNDLSAAYILKAKNRRSRFELSPMKKFACDGIYDYYRAYFENCDSRSVYLFQLNSGCRRAYYGFKGLFEPGKDGFLAANSFAVPDCFFLNVNKIFWWPDAIFYQIFPDRFYDGDSSLNQDYVEKWGSAPKLDNFNGGDLKGITGKISYLKNLGISAVYLNPIFKSFSNHKYDTVDYYQIDSSLGGIDAFTQLARKLRANGIRLILDGVFNHTSTDFFAFADARKNGAKSRYADWYNFKSFPVDMQNPDYDCWWNIGSMPRLNIKNPSVYEYLLNAARHWMETGLIDGYRLDVPEQLPHSFWKDFRKMVKSIDCQAYIVGEIWEDGSKWLAGDQFDAVMNYKLRNALISFFVKKEITSAEFDIKLAFDKISLPDSAFYSMFNLLGSHDTPRILTVCNGSAAVLKQLVLFIMTYPGTPCVYYGDEIGLCGGKDPDNRGCMKWDETQWNMDIYNFYKKAIAIRNENIELRRGEVFTYPLSEEALKNDGLYSFVRVYKNSAVAVVFNNGGGRRDVKFLFKTIYNFIEGGRAGYAGYKKILVSNLINGVVTEYSPCFADGFDAAVEKEGFAVYKISFVNDENK